MGITISYRGGAVPEKVVDHIISQLEEQYKREGYVEGCKEPVTGQYKEKCYMKYEKPVEERDKESFKRETISQEKESAQYWQDEYLRDPDRKVGEQEDGTPITGRTHAEAVRKTFQERVRRGVFLPDNFNPTREKSICLNPDPHSETFCVRFIQDDNKDSWRMPREFCKTQFVKNKSVHVELCEYIKDVQKKVKDAGADLEIVDEGDYCDDRLPQGNREKLEKAHEENRKVIDKIGVMLTEAGWGTKEVEVKPAPTVTIDVPPGVPEPGPRGGSLDYWMGLREADLLVTVKPTRVLLPREEQLIQLWEKRKR